MVGHITLYGEIIPWQDEGVSQWGAVNLKGIMQEINSQPEAEEFVVHIHSPGGEVMEAFAIYDALKATGKKITTMVEGLCASAATIPFLAGEDRKMTENSEFMIHLPFGMAFGDSDDLQKSADSLKEVEEKVVNFYARTTGNDPDVIREQMKEETWMDVNTAKDQGWVTEVITTMKAVATLKTRNKMTQATMSVEDFNKAFDEKSETWLQKIMNKIRGVKMITVTTADGTILDFGDSVEEESQIAVGTTATVDGSPAEGEFVLADGRTLVFEGGAVTEIREAEGGDEMETLKKENEDLKAEVESLKAAQATAAKEKADMEANVEKQIKEGLEKFKAEMKSDLGKSDPGQRKPKEGADMIRRGEKTKE